jgi:3-deoxy-D-arabino-heptulosonate 7-phosphate (DAHP) synthase
MTDREVRSDHTTPRSASRRIVATAAAVKAGGATALRGGAFKPRTSPYSFQGMKERGLELLAEARAEVRRLQRFAADMTA